MTTTSISPGELRFVNNYVPALQPDQYTISAKQTLSASGDVGYRSTTATQLVEVAAPRFQLPPQDIHREFPPPNSQGQFASVLPHIVLTKRALPWERNIFGEGNASIPWMALLLLQQDTTTKEIIVPSGGSVSATYAQTISVGEFLTPNDGTIAAPQAMQPAVPAPMLQTNCQVVQISTDTFNLVVPSQDNLPYLAHCRLADLSRKAVPDNSSPANPKLAGLHFYSVVVGSRFPQAPPSSSGEHDSVNVAHLVSLEGFENYVRTNQSDGPVAFPSGATSVRLVSFASWSFSALKQTGQSFAQLMEGLVPKGGDSSKLMLNVPIELPATPPADPTSAQKATYDTLTSGYIATGYATRQGEKTFAWYRGPFTPTLPPPLTDGAVPLGNSARAVVYDPTTGVFDHSYAAAFETGRLMALNSKSFGANLLRWRRSSHQLVDLLYDRITNSALKGVYTSYGDGDPKTPPSPEQGQLAEDLRALIETNLVTDIFVQNLVDVLSAMQKSAEGKRVTPTVTPVVPPPEPVELKPIESLSDLMDEPGVQALLKDMRQSELAPVTGWLAKLYLLYGVPFNTLVPDGRMLPPESVRFFYIDDNWLIALLNGALSIGIQSSRDSRLQNVMGKVIVDAVKATIHEIRTRQLGLPSPDSANEAATGQSGPMAGMLLRSAAVSGWPGLEVQAFEGSDDTSGQVRLLRMTHLSGDVLLCLFNKIPGCVTIHEPREGLHFGVEDFDDDHPAPTATSTDQPVGLVDLRYLNSADGPVAAFMDPAEPANKSVAAYTIVNDSTDTRLLDIQQLLSDLKSSPLGETPDPAGFAIEMIDAPEEMTCTNNLQA